MSGPSSAPMPTGGPLLERNNTSTPGQTPQQSTGLALQPNSLQSQPSSAPAQAEKDRDVETEGRQLTAIFRPDDAGEWKERLRLSHEASEQARTAREGQTEDEEDVKEDESEVEDDDSNVGGEGEGTKIWKAKRTLRKLVCD